jgi:selenide, water dikinase
VHALNETNCALLTDPQTSGGLLIGCAAEALPSVLAVFRDDGFLRAAVIGERIAGEPRVAVR